MEPGCLPFCRHPGSRLSHRPRLNLDEAHNSAPRKEVPPWSQRGPPAPEDQQAAPCLARFILERGRWGAGRGHC